MAAGDSCEIRIPDQAGAPSQDISFGPAVTTTTDTTTTTTNPASTTSTTTVTSSTSPQVVTSTGTAQTTSYVVVASSVPAATGTTKTVLPDGTLAFTGVGNGLWVLAFAGVIFVNLGLLVLLLFYRPRELASGAGRRISRIFGRK